MRRALSIITPAALVLAQGAAIAADFDPAVSLATPQRPAGVAAADFNGDGIVDLAVATDNMDKISIFFGTGAGSFSAPVSIFTGSGTGPDSLLAADIDGDGDMDLAIVLKGIDTFRVYINTAGVFTAGGSASVGQRPVNLAMGDIDGDGDIDFVTVNRDDNSISVVTNNAGAWSASSIAVGDDPRTAAIADLTGDGIADIAVSNHDDRTISILAGGGGTFSPAATLSLGSDLRPDGLVAADLDGDGDMDLAATTSGTIGGSTVNFASVFINMEGVMTGPVNYAVGAENPDEIDAADLDGDGILELVVVARSPGRVAVLDGLGGGAFAAGVAYAVGADPDRLAIADLDGNGMPDLAVTNTSSHSISLLFNQLAPSCSIADLAPPFGAIDFFDVTEFLTLYQAGDLGADFDGNGTLDFFDVAAFLNAFAAGCP